MDDYIYYPFGWTILPGEATNIRLRAGAPACYCGYPRSRGEHFCGNYRRDWFGTPTVSCRVCNSFRKVREAAIQEVFSAYPCWKFPDIWRNLDDGFVPHPGLSGMALSLLGHALHMHYYRRQVMPAKAWNQSWLYHFAHYYCETGEPPQHNAQIGWRDLTQPLQRGNWMWVIEGHDYYPEDLPYGLVTPPDLRQVLNIHPKETQ